MEKTPPDEKAISAGIEEITKAFGFYVTLDMISQYTGQPDNVLLKSSFYEFFTKVVYLSHINSFKKRYNDLITKR